MDHRGNLMRRIVIAGTATVSGLVLLFAWQNSTDEPAPVGTTDAEGEGASGATDDSTSRSGGDRGTSETFTGAAEPTEFGDVQVEITVIDGQISDATALSYPDTSPRDKEINAEAIPILEEATVAAQGADFDMVSGATVTSTAYLGSLQDALDQAGL